MTAREGTFAGQDPGPFSAAGVDPAAWEVRKPVIAAMNGHAVGIGLTLALQCEIAADIANNTAPLSVAVTKRLLWESPNLTRAEVGHRETALHHHLMGHADAVEGPMAWIERRPPQWKLNVKKDWPS